VRILVEKLGENQTLRTMGRLLESPPDLERQLRSRWRRFQRRRYHSHKFDDTACDLPRLSRLFSRSVVGENRL
jgi:hypothetical protein